MKSNPLSENAFNSQREYVLQNIPKSIRVYITGNIRGNNQPLLQEQQDVLQDFYVYLVTESGTATRFNTYLNHLSYLGRFAQFIKKPFNHVTKEDIKNYLFYCKAHKNKDSTLNQYRMTFRVFFRFLYGTESPDVIKWIELSKRQKKEISPDMLLTKIEIKAMIDVACLSRDRALVAVLYESAARRDEVLSCCKCNVIPDRYGMKLKLPESKTKPRTVRLIDSVPYLQTWINEHPIDNPEAPLFCGLEKNFGGRLTGQWLKDKIKKLSKQARIQKNVYPHLFRHSRLDSLAKQGFNERDLKLIAGWSDGSEMPNIYLHYDEKYVDEKLLRNVGLLTDEIVQEEQKEKEALKPRECPRCKLINSASSKYCNSCGMALDLKELMQDQEIAKAKTEEGLKAYVDIMSDPVKKIEFEKFKKIFFDKR